jgi:hypothetical protein
MRTTISTRHRAGDALLRAWLADRFGRFPMNPGPSSRTGFLFLDVK